MSRLARIVEVKKVTPGFGEAEKGVFFLFIDKIK